MKSLPEYFRLFCSCDPSVGRAVLPRRQGRSAARPCHENGHRFFETALAAVIFSVTFLLTGCVHRNSSPPEEETALFNGRGLSGWRVSDFAGHGDVRVEDGQIVFDTGAGLTGITWTNEPPARVNYQIELDAVKVAGSDFFCGITFPVNETYCSLIVGGWGGAVVGISSINGADASSNETTDYRRFETGQWYHVRVRVSESKIEVWIDGEQFVDLDYTGKTLSVRADINQSTPLGLSAWQTRAAMKNIVISRW